MVTERWQKVAEWSMFEVCDSEDVWTGEDRCKKVSGFQRPRIG